MIHLPDATALAASYRAARPFRHAVIDGLCEPHHRAQLQAAFGAEPLARVEGEIYSHLRSSDPPQQPALRSFFEELSTNHAAVEEICGTRFSRMDGSAYAYLEGDYLLPHSDSRAGLGRAVPGSSTCARRKRAAPAAWKEAACPACIGVTLLADRLPGLAGLTGAGPVSPGRDEQPEGQPVMRLDRPDRTRPV